MLHRRPRGSAARIFADVQASLIGGLGWGAVRGRAWCGAVEQQRLRNTGGGGAADAAGVFGQPAVLSQCRKRTVLPGLTSAAARSLLPALAQSDLFIVAVWGSADSNAVEEQSALALVGLLGALLAGGLVSALPAPAPSASEVVEPRAASVLRASPATRVATRTNRLSADPRAPSGRGCSAGPTTSCRETKHDGLVPQRREASAHVERTTLATPVVTITSIAWWPSRHQALLLTRRGSQPRRAGVRNRARSAGRVQREC